MAITLEAALAQHQITDFNMIGTRHWTYLSYDRTRGWDVVKFEGICGFFQQFFRWLFGCYANTHLRVIAHQIERESAGSVPPILLAKVRAAWARQVDAFSIASDLSSWRIGNTRLSIRQGDITELQIRAIVNAANPQCLGGGGIDGAIHAAAGPQLLEECSQLPIQRSPDIRCPVGQAVITGSGNLAPRIRHIIHTVGPDMGTNPRNGEELLRNCYANVLQLAANRSIREIALPSISTGIYRYPFEAATRLAIQTVQDFVRNHPDCFDRIVFIYFDQRSLERASTIANELRATPRG